MRKQNRIMFLLAGCIFGIGWLALLGVGLGVREYGTGHTSASRGAPSAYDGIEFNTWDVKAASQNVPTQSKKKYTLMVYMNGSDLESESGAATGDLRQMLDARVDADLVNLLLFTGGTNRWQNNVIPENTCAVWRLTSDGLQELATVGLYNMGNPGTLSSFITFCTDNFPAEKYGLIMWDHGGGSIAGYGHDEKFNASALSLLDMGYAFEKAGLSKNKLEFLGFDSCLMATVEMALVSSDYAKYLIASEDLEPGDGWDYRFLSELNRDPSMDGAALGKIIVNYFMDYYGPDSEEILTLSVVDLSQTAPVMDSMGRLMELCSQKLTTERASSFTTLAKKRYGTKTFGEGSPGDNECDMVDIGDMAAKLSDLFPKEAQSVQSALVKAVVYNRHNANTDLKGLSTFYIYGGKDYAYLSLPTYASLSMDSGYTGYLFQFAELLNNPRSPSQSRTARSSLQTPASTPNRPSGDNLLMASLTLWQPVDGNEDRFRMTGIQHDAEIASDGSPVIQKDAKWPMINGKPVCLYPIGHTSDHSLYAVPASINGMDGDIIVVLGRRHPEGKILGVRKEDGFIIQKGFDPITKDDKVELYYQERCFVESADSANNTWQQSEPVTVQDGLSLSWYTPDEQKSGYRLLLTDIWLNEHYEKIN